MRNRRTVATLAVTIAAVSLHADPPPTPTLTLTRIADDIPNPVHVATPPNDPSSIFIADQRDTANTGRIHIVRNGQRLATPFLEFPDMATTLSMGLVCFAFDPDYETNGHVYVNYSRSDLVVRIARFTRDAANPDTADPDSEHTIITLPQPTHLHNGGWLAFGPDGHIYLSSGDGGEFADPDKRGQDTSSLLGKILRINPHADDFPLDPERNYAIPADNPFVGLPPLDEIWALGVREPWRCSFDRATGDLYIADVGEDGWEEINVQPAASAGGENYGWRCFEGHDPLFDDPECAGVAFVDPVHAYNHDAGDCSITGGHVYHADATPALSGRYVFADWCTSRFWSLDTADPTDIIEHALTLEPPATELGRINAIGTDACGELYICSRFGQVFRVGPPPTTDCNANGVDDGCEIDVGATPDANINGIPDACESLCDVTSDGAVDIADLLDYLALWFAQSPLAERTGENPPVINVIDLLAFISCWFDAA